MHFQLKITTIQAQNAESVCAEIAAYLGEQTGMTTRFINDIPWQERERLFDAGEIHINWMCGLPYVRKADAGAPPVELLAAPVMRGERYAGRAVYFSDVVTLAESPFRAFDDLRGAIWSFNEPNSHSGHNMTRYFLATLGERNGFFGQVTQSGAHQTSLRWLLERRIDAAAIDSTVLETELAANPSLRNRLRRIAVLGPSPIPPWVARADLPADVRHAIREALLAMHTTSAGRAILRRGRMSHFAAVTDADYDPIREMAKLADTVSPWV